MSKHTPIIPEPPAGDGSSREITFDPVPVRYRHDGWTAERQIAFVEKLADTGSITAACKHVGMSRKSVRKLRRRPCGRAFRDAIDAALDCGYVDLEEAAMERSRKGVARPVFYKGEQVGEWRHHDEHLTMFLLRFRRRHRFGPEADGLPRNPADIPGYDPDEKLPFDPELELDGCLDGLEFAPDPPPDYESDAEPERAMKPARTSRALAYARACTRMSLPTLATSAARRPAQCSPLVLPERIGYDCITEAGLGRR